MSKKKTIKVKFASYAQNCGDGSICVKFFPNIVTATEYAESCEFDERFSDDIRSHYLEFDSDGNLLTKAN